MNKLHFTQEQITKILEQVAAEKDGINTLLKISLEAMMRAERSEHTTKNEDVSKGYRFRKSFGQGKLT